MKDTSAVGGPAMLTVKQAADKLGVSVALLYSLIGARKIRHERHGLGRGRILIPEDALAEYRKRQTVEVAIADYGPARRTFRHLKP